MVRINQRKIMVRVGGKRKRVEGVEELKGLKS
jgi:hypothetical protein